MRAWMCVLITLLAYNYTGQNYISFQLETLTFVVVNSGCFGIP